MVAAPGSIRAHQAGAATFIALGADEGGRKKPFGLGYRPQLFFGTTSVTATVTGIEGGHRVDPGSRVNIGFALDRPVGFEAGVRFAAREGGRTIGAGIVTHVEPG